MSGSGAYQWVVTIAGLGREHGAFASTAQRIRPMAMSVGGAARQTAAGSTLLDQYVACLVPGSVSFGSSGVNPLSGEFKSSTASFEIVLNDTAWPEVGRFFLASRAVRQPLAFNAVTLNPVSTAVTLTTADGSTLTAIGITTESIIYNRREAWRVQTVDNGTGVVGFYDQTPDPDDYRTTEDVQRSTTAIVGEVGHIGTLMARHPGRGASSDGAPPPVPDNRWYRTTPFIAGREVTIYRRSGVAGEPESVFWRGVISGNPEIDRTGLVVTVRCVDLLDSIRKRRFNERPLNVVGFAPVVYGDGLYYLNANAPDLTLEESEKRTVWGAPAASGASTSGYFPAVLQVGDSAILARRYALIRSGNATTVYAEGPWRNVLGSDSLPEARDVKRLRVYELLVSDPLDESSPLTGGDAINPADHPYYCENAPSTSSPGSTVTGVLRHPLLIALAHLGQLDCPNLPEHWKLQLPRQFVDAAGVIELARRAYASIDEWPGIVGGKGGKPIEALTWIGEQLRAIGCAFALTGPGGAASNGVAGSQITVRTILDVTTTLANTVALAQLLPGRPVSLDTSISADTVTAEAGIGLSGDPALIIIGDEVYDTEFFPYQSSSYRFSAGGVLHPDDTGIGPLTYSRIQLIRRFVQVLATLFRFPLQLASRSITYDRPVQAGEFLLIDDVGGRSEQDGTVIPAGTLTPKLVFVTTVSANASDALTQQASLLVMPFDVTRIGPTASVVPGSTDTVVNLADAVWIQLTTGPYVAAPGVSAEYDVQTFEVGQFVVICSPSLEVLTDPAEIAAIDDASTPKTITFTGAIQALGGGSYLAIEDDLVILARRQDAAPADVDRFAFVSHSTYTA